MELTIAHADVRELAANAANNTAASPWGRLVLPEDEALDQVPIQLPESALPS